MRINNKYIFLLCILSICNLLTLRAQNIDSLTTKYEEFKKSDCDSTLFAVSKQIFISSSENNTRLKYSKIAFKLGLDNHNPRWCALAKCYEGYAYQNLNNLDSAFLSYNASEKYYALYHNKSGVGICKISLGDILTKQNKYEQAIPYYKDALLLFTNLNDTSRQTATLINIGEVYRLQHDYSSALSCFYKASNTLKTIPNYLHYINYLSFVKGNIGLVYVEENKLDSAKLFLNYAIENLKKINNNGIISNYLNGLSRVYLQEDKYKEALQTSMNSLQIAKQYHKKEQIRDASLQLSNIYDKIKNYKKAFFYHSKYIAYKDSLNNEENILKIEDLHSKFELAKKQKEIDSQKAHKDLYRIILILLVFILGLLGTTIFILSKHIKEKKNANLLLINQKNALMTANTTKNKFFSVLSHDLRSPLATFSSSAEFMAMCASDKDIENILDINEDLKSSSNNLLDLLDNLLQWGVNQMNETRHHPQMVNIKNVVKAEVTHLENVSKNKGISICIEIPEQLSVYVDNITMGIAIRNLINNALKFTLTGGNITIEAWENNDTIQIKVTDTGVGMSQQQIDKLFSPEKMTSTYGTQNEKGVGLGLQLVQSFVQNNHASLHVESTVGKGTSFIMMFKKIEIQGP